VYTPHRTRKYEKYCGQIAFVVKLHHPAFREIIEQPIQLFVDFYIYHDRKYKSCPDPDNVIKSVLDGLQKVIYEDDRQVLPRVQVVEYECKQPRVELRIEVI
jgi:Holliday junction resolvase RusA-like endonuclease